MTLHPHPSHPSAGCYVLKLHRDARPRHGLLCGRLEHIVSGDSLDFECAEDLLSWLLAHATQIQADASRSTDTAGTEI
jgi:hypothetical protein